MKKESYAACFIFRNRIWMLNFDRCSCYASYNTEKWLLVRVGIRQQQNRGKSKRLFSVSRIATRIGRNLRTAIRMWLFVIRLDELRRVILNALQYHKFLALLTLKRTETLSGRLLKIVQPRHIPWVRKRDYLQYGKYPHGESEDFWSSMDCLHDDNYCGFLCTTPWKRALTDLFSTTELNKGLVPRILLWRVLVLRAASW